MMGTKRPAHKSRCSVLLDGQANVELGTLARFAGAVDAAAQQMDHQVVDDVGAEPAATPWPRLEVTKGSKMRGSISGGCRDRCHCSR